MKTIIACLITSLVALPIMAQPMLQQGTRAVGLSGRIDDDGDDLGVFMSGSAGYFIMDYVEVGIAVSGGFRGSDFKTLSVGGYGEFNFDIGSDLVPYIGAQAGLTWYDTKFDDDTVLEFGAYGGARYFFINYAAIGADLLVKAATEDIYNGGKDATDWVIRLLTTWYF